MLARLEPSDRSEGGFTLIEVLVALVIISVGLFALLTVFISSLRSAQEQEAHSQATRIGTQTLEEFRGKAFEDIAVGDHDDYPEDYERTIDAGGREFDVSIQVSWEDAVAEQAGGDGDEDDDTEAGLKRVEVTVAWQVLGNDRSNTFATAISPRDGVAASGPEQSLGVTVQPSALAVTSDGDVREDRLEITADVTGFGDEPDVRAGFVRYDLDEDGEIGDPDEGDEVALERDDLDEGIWSWSAETDELEDVLPDLEPDREATDWVHVEVTADDGTRELTRVVTLDLTTGVALNAEVEPEGTIEVDHCDDGDRCRPSDDVHLSVDPLAPEDVGAVDGPVLELRFEGQDDEVLDVEWEGDHEDGWDATLDGGEDGEALFPDDASEVTFVFSVDPESEDDEVVETEVVRGLRHAGDPTLVDVSLREEPILIASDDAADGEHPVQVRDGEEADWEDADAGQNLLHLELDAVVALPGDEHPEDWTVTFRDAEENEHDLELHNGADDDELVYRLDLAPGDASFSEVTDGGRTEITFDLVRDEDGDHEDRMAVRHEIAEPESANPRVEPDPIEVTSPDPEDGCDHQNDCVFEDDFSFNVGEHSDIDEVLVELETFDDELDDDHEPDGGEWSPGGGWNNPSLDPRDSNGAQFHFTMTYETYRITETVIVEVEEE